MNARRDTAEVSASFAPPGPPEPRPDPTEPDFIRRCEDPTREEICINSLAISLRGRVEDGQISQNEADQKLTEYRQRLEREPFTPGLQVFMSVRVLGGVWKHSKARRGARLVLLALADFANDDGEAWPSIKSLAAKTCLSERNTQYALRILERSGEIKILRNKGQITAKGKGASFCTQSVI